MRVFSDIADTIKHDTFRLLVPEGYVPNIHSVYLEENAPEMFCVPHEFDRVYVNYPVTYIVDMYYNKVDFEFQNGDDVFAVHHILELYLRTYSSNEEALADPPTKRFIDMATKTYNAFDKRVRISRRAQSNKEPKSILEMISMVSEGN